MTVKQRQKSAAQDAYSAKTASPTARTSAIYADGTHTIIDPEICEDCHVCQYVCPRNVIKEMEVPEYIFMQREALGIKEGE